MGDVMLAPGGFSKVHARRARCVRRQVCMRSPLNPLHAAYVCMQTNFHSSPAQPQVLSMTTLATPSVHQLKPYFNLATTPAPAGSATPCPPVPACAHSLSSPILLLIHPFSCSLCF